jgi:alkylation response protein AidB-like acyl-CoA dehydrogenase
MSSKLEDVLSTVDRIATEVIGRDAARVDREAAFPTEAIGALGKAGVLGLISAPDVGGLGLGPRAAALVIERIARECGSTAMVVCMHYAGTAVIEKLGPASIRKAIAEGSHLTTLAFSEIGSRGQFWAPVSKAERAGTMVTLTGRKSFVTSAHHAQSYVWSSKPTAGSETSTLWLVPQPSAGLRIGEGFDGLGLRGNDSCPVTAESAPIPASAMLGADGAGFGIMLELVLPWFNLMVASVSVGLMEASTTATAAHASGTTFEHSGSTIADLPTARAYIARMRIKTDLARCLVADTAAAIETGRADAVLRVLESKAAAGELATEVVDLAMRVCGGAAYRREVGVERQFRDARAGLVMAPTTDVLFDFIGKVACNQPLFQEQPA